MEIWKDIKGYEGYYQISSLGKIKGLPRKVSNGKGVKLLPEKLLKQKTIGDGYLGISLSKEGKFKNKYTHRLVAQHFIRNPKKKPTVNHKNGIKTDNRLENLEWATQSQNNKHAYDSGLKTPKKGKNHWMWGSNNINAKKVINTRTGKIYNCMKEAAEETGHSQQYLSNMLNGHCKNKTNLRYL